MKHFMTGMMLALALTLALVMGVAAVAENAEPAVPQTPAVEQAPAETPAEDAGATDSAALQEALDAYKSARQSDRQQALEEELKGYVADGKLTQEQADLILNHFKDRQAQRGSGNGKGGRMNGNKGGRMNGGMGGRGGKGGHMNGGMGRGMKGTAQQPAQNGAEGTAKEL